ncbi:MAG: hypothetical protein PV344_02680, partial [Anaplasma sp.]|nr:hypothetical protein [Anaplasma sp.]
WTEQPRKRAPTMSTGTASQQNETPAAASPLVYLPVAPRTPASFHGEVYEDVEDWVSQYERVARYNRWDAEQSLRNVY